MDFNHPGPLLAHLSRVPDGESVLEYDGSGEWVKIHSLGLDLNEDGSVHWLAYNYQKLPGRVSVYWSLIKRQPLTYIVHLYHPGTDTGGRVFAPDGPHLARTVGAANLHWRRSPAVCYLCSDTGRKRGYRAAAGGYKNPRGTADHRAWYVFLEPLLSSLCKTLYLTSWAGMRTSLSMYRSESLDEGYVYPGGLLWNGEELIEDKPDV